jgi:hypothetical protein
VESFGHKHGRANKEMCALKPDSGFTPAKLCLLNTGTAAQSADAEWDEP